MNQDHGQHVPRRTHSFDSYDTLDRLEELRHRRNQFFSNRAKFERQPPAVPPPEVPSNTDRPTRPITPTSKLIQNFTGKLKEISTMDVTDSKQPPPLPKRSLQRTPNLKSNVASPKPSGSNLQVISLESPKKITYRTTCQIFPTFQIPSSNTQQSYNSITNHSQSFTDLNDEPKAVKQQIPSGYVMATPFQIVTTASERRSFSSIENDMITSPSVSRSSSFTEKKPWNNSRNSSPKSTEESVQYTIQKCYELNATPFQRPVYDQERNGTSTTIAYEHVCKKHNTTTPDGNVRTFGEVNATPFSRPVYQQQELLPINEPCFVKDQVDVSGYSLATPFQTTVTVTKVVPEIKPIEKLYIEESFMNHANASKIPVPFPRSRNQTNMAVDSSSPRSYPLYLRQQSAKEWKPVDALFSRASSTYSSLPHRKSQPDRSRYLATTLNVTDSTSSAAELRQTNNTMASLTPTMGKPPVHGSRRVSTGSLPEMKTRSQASFMPVKDLVQMFSNL